MESLNESDEVCLIVVLLLSRGQSGRCGLIDNFIHGF